MKKNLIDTNLLYDLAGINDSNKTIDWDLLKNKINAIGEFSVSELSLFELYTHKGFDEEQRNLVKNYIINNKIKVVKSLPDISSFIENTKNLNLENLETINKITSIKAKIEGETLRSCIYIISYIFYYFLYLHVNPDLRGFYTFQINCLLESNEKQFLDNSITIIKDFYDKGEPPKNKIQSVLDSMLYSIFFNYELSFQQITIVELIERTKTYNENSSIPLFELKQKISNSKKGLLCEKDLYWKKLEESILFMKSFFKQNSPHEKNYISYYCYYAYQFLTNGKKFEKNNLIDSLFHFHDDQYIVYTLDSFLLETYKDETQYDFLKCLQKEIFKIT